MAISLRFDAVTPLNGAGAAVGFTGGIAPLSGEASGKAMETSIAKLNAMLAGFDPFQALMLMAFARWKQVNPALDNPSLVVGMTITFDATQAVNLVKIS